MIRDAASQNQVDAADPHRNTWLSANAGSGKTRVLTDRVARLLLDGVSPQNILCLTYTKAAASEMQNRLFQRLGAWSMLSDADLRKDLQRLGADDKSGQISLSEARCLFARAIETPGGLKIQTIHSFCSSVLRRFPLEAGVSPQFVELDETAAELLQEECLDDIAEGPNKDILRRVLDRFPSVELLKLTAAISKESRYFLAPFDEAGLRRDLSVRPDFKVSDLIEAVFEPGWKKTLSDLITVLRTSGKNDQKDAAKLDPICSQSPDLSTLRDLEDVFLYGDKAKAPFAARVDRFPTKPIQKAHPDLVETVHEFMESVADAREQRLSFLAFERAQTLHQFGSLFVQIYEAKKLERGVLDFDDLIEKTLFLLKDSKVAQWVLYRLDGGIDHLLVDEAQDTSPIQWSVIEALTQEFSSGASARENQKRTVFVVGDKKQSIYSFQGADPKEFDRMRAHFDQALNEAQTPLQTPELRHSFRSSSAILNIVDHVFQGDRGDAIGGTAAHFAFNDDLPGRVDIWPLIEKSDDAEYGQDWFEPIDTLQESHHDVRLAEQIADEIGKTIAQEILPVKNRDTGEIGYRKITEGDFLILVQRRSDLFNEIIRACKSKGLKVAGADRLQLNAELAVKDICAILSFLALPEDSLSLANALKSPLFDWSEQDLYALAYHRTEDHLWQALRNSTEHPKTLGVLNDLRSKSDFLRPYEIIERLLTRHDGRRKLLRRLGVEAADGIDALLTQAINYESKGTPSLTGFLCWLESEMTEIKRQSDSQSDEIRVMTVHGAKGLEAPIVILPDTADRQNRLQDAIVKFDGQIHWKPASDETPSALQDGLSAIKDAQENERMRLLYVAMTRAENWLIVCGAGQSNIDKGSWYAIVDAALDHADRFEIVRNGEVIKRVEFGDWHTTPTLQNKVANTSSAPLPTLQSIEPSMPTKTLSPSDLGGAKALAGEPHSEEDGLARGRAIHHLLENMTRVPADERSKFATKILANHPDGPVLNQSDIDQTIALLDDQKLSWIFAPNAIKEVPISTNLPTLNGARMHGIIDRLVIEDETITAVDFKSNSTTPTSASETPEGILRQMGAYAEALSQIYPDKQIKTAILWTETAEIFDLSNDLVSSALARVNTP
ncbi:DNA helicase/exodeoxyribonuclease V, subunit A [Cognatiyoonia sediminum]|uniref:DNA 3'-5' helicase n=1 Tax=Cognatiyoonia sediminum TaxID=1508389 RepID=A0A1M5QQ72_9RHOB|nr:double-strand break repair helicase AddA [Cognatiyoonia sediminum]SHH15929.1 DNA helicase/exodeoxyribonuclease V, subunit A [Cognatiyoonia sediminum]